MACRGRVDLRLATSQQRAHAVVRDNMNGPNLLMTLIGTLLPFVCLGMAITLCTAHGYTGRHARAWSGRRKPPESNADETICVYTF